MADDDDWMTSSQAAELADCPVPTVEWHTRQGRIERRACKGNRPSVRRPPVEAFALWWANDRARAGIETREITAASTLQGADRTRAS